MSTLTQEQFDTVPEFLKAEFEKVGDGYQHASAGKINSLKTSLDALDGKFKVSESAKAAEIEVARAQALDQARSKGDVKAIEERYQQQMADLEKRNGETLKERDLRIEKMSATAKKGGIDSIVAQLSDLATPEGKAAFNRLVRQRIDYNPETGQNTFLNDDGSASSLDLKGFVSDLAKDALFAPLLAASFATSGGGNAQGGGLGGSASQSMKRRDFDAKPPAFRADFMRQGGKLTD